MRTVNIRQFQRNFYQEIKELPIVVTRRKQPIFVISLPKKNKVIIDKNKGKDNV